MRRQRTSMMLFMGSQRGAERREVETDGRRPQNAPPVPVPSRRGSIPARLRPAKLKAPYTCRRVPPPLLRVVPNCSMPIQIDKFLRWQIRVK